MTARSTIRLILELILALAAIAVALVANYMMATRVLTEPVVIGGVISPQGDFILRSALGLATYSAVLVLVTTAFPPRRPAPRPVPNGPAVDIVVANLVVVAYAGVLAWQSTAGGRLLMTYGGMPEPIWAVMVLVFVLVTPAAEELFYRDWLWRRLDDVAPPIVAPVLTSLIWAFANIGEGATKVVILLPVGFVLAYIRAQTGRVLPAIVTRVLYTGVQVAALYLSVH